MFALGTGVTEWVIVEVLHTRLRFDVQKPEIKMGSGSVLMQKHYMPQE